MTIRSGFFNSVNGDRKYDASWFALYFSRFIGNGVFPTPSNGLQVIADVNMRVVVKPGDGWINGHFLNNDSDYTLTLDNADGVLKRIDRIVMRLNHLTRTMNEIIVKKGTFASTPVAPPLQRDTEYYELALADVYISAGATTITQANITDQRLNKDLCGIVHGTVDQVDTTTIFNQYQQWFEEMTGQKLDEYDAWFEQHQQEFNAWFASIQNILDENVASNLLNLINENKESIEDIREYSTYKSNKDIDGLFTTIQLKRSDGTLYLVSQLGGYINQLYTTRTETRYAADGVTVAKVINYNRVYDSDGDFVEEVIQ